MCWEWRLGVRMTQIGYNDLLYEIEKELEAEQVLDRLINMCQHFLQRSSVTDVASWMEKLKSSGHLGIDNLGDLKEILRCLEGKQPLVDKIDSFEKRRRGNRTWWCCCLTRAAKKHSDCYHVHRIVPLPQSIHGILLFTTDARALGRVRNVARSFTDAFVGGESWLNIPPYVIVNQLG